MGEIRLLPFQAQAAKTIADRFEELRATAKRPFMTADWPVPFYQALSALTGAGKTPILADAVALIRADRKSVV